MKPCKKLFGKRLQRVAADEFCLDIQVVALFIAHKKADVFQTYALHAVIDGGERGIGHQRIIHIVAADDGNILGDTLVRLVQCAHHPHRGRVRQAKDGIERITFRKRLLRAAIAELLVLFPRVIPGKNAALAAVPAVFFGQFAKRMDARIVEQQPAPQSADKDGAPLAALLQALERLAHGFGVVDVDVEVSVAVVCPVEKVDRPDFRLVYGGTVALGDDDVRQVDNAEYAHLYDFVDDPAQIMVCYGVKHHRIAVFLRLARHHFD